MTHSDFPRLGKLQAALCLAFAVGSAHAAVDMTAYGKIDLAGANVYEETQTSQYNVDILPWNWYNSSPNSALIHTYGSYDGSFGSRSSGNGIYEVHSTFSIVETWTNPSASAIQGKFNFNIVPGQVANYQRTSYETGEYVAANMAMNILINGTNRWSTAAGVSSNASGTTMSHTGVDIGYIEHGQQSDWYNSDNATGYYFNNYAGQLDLGTIAAGETITVQYDILTHAEGNSVNHGGITIPGYTQHVPEQQVWVWDNGYGGGCYGDICEFTAPSAYGGDIGSGHWETIAAHDVWISEQTTSGGANGSIAQTGDPFSISGGEDENGNYVPGTNYQPNYPYTGNQLPLQGGIQPVPEPETYAMMLAGLLGVAWSVRRRKR